VLDGLKGCISKPPVPASPEPGETLLRYIAATTQVDSTALVVEWEEPRHVYKVQRLVYYISKDVQKLLYVVLIMKHKLLHYFESHPIWVVNSFGLREIIRNRLTMGRIAKWALELMGLDLAYVPKTMIKCVVMLVSPKGDRLLYVVQLHFHATNNVAEYEALVNGLCIAAELGIKQFYIRGDSELIINQVMGDSNYHDSRMVTYRQEVRRLEDKFNGFELHHILRWDKEAADTLAWLESSRESPPPGVFTQDPFKPSIRLEKDTPALAPGASLSEGGLVLKPGPPPGEFCIAPESGAGLRTSVGPIISISGQARELVVVAESPGPEAEW
jgi:ribonuclease HI